jgi:hypothetical protein
MRDYSKPPYTAGEILYAFIGVCDTLGKNVIKPEFESHINAPYLVSSHISRIFAQYGITEKIYGDFGLVAISLQKLITFLLDKNIVERDELEKNINSSVDIARSKGYLPPDSLMDFFKNR